MSTVTSGPMVSDKHGMVRMDGVDERRSDS